jgi:hypothetical protein
LGAGRKMAGVWVSEAGRRGWARGGGSGGRALDFACRGGEFYCCAVASYT